MAPTATTRTDLVRQIVVISAFVFMIIGAMVGTGLFGGVPVQDLQQGALDADGSFLAPARPAFSIWTAIYLGLAAYTVWQALPAQRADARQRRIGWLIAVTMVLNGLWLIAAQVATLLLTVVMIVLLLAALCVTFQRIVATPARTWVDLVLIDGVTGLHLGWVSLATAANITAWLTQGAPARWGVDPSAWGVGVLIAVAIVGIAVALVSRGKIAPGLALAWGLSWLAVARLTGEPASTPIGVAAIVVAVIVLALPLAITTARITRGSEVLQPA